MRFPLPSSVRPERSQMLSPQEKGSNSWSYLTISWINAWHPGYYASQHYTLKQEHTGYVFFFFFKQIVSHYHAAQGNNLWDLHLALLMLHKCYIRIIGFSKREYESPIWHLIFLSVSKCREEHKYHCLFHHIVLVGQLQLKIEENIERKNCTSDYLENYWPWWLWFHDGGGGLP